MDLEICNGSNRIGRSATPSSGVSDVLVVRHLDSNLPALFPSFHLFSFQANSESLIAMFASASATDTAGFTYVFGGKTNKKRKSGAASPKPLTALIEDARASLTKELYWTSLVGQTLWPDTLLV